MVRFESALHSMSEQTPLASNDITARSRSRSTERSRFSPVTLIIPIAIICRLAIMLPTTTDFEVLRIISCRLWYWTYDPSSIPPDGHIPDLLCYQPVVKEYFTGIASLIAVVNGVGAILGSSAASFFASRMGRKPVLLGVMMSVVVGHAFIVGSQIVQGWLQLEISFYVLAQVCQSTGNILTMMFVVNMYIVDLVPAEDRTAALSKIAGWATLGGALSFMLGGSITAQSNSMITVYLVSIIALASTSIYTAIMLPESFPISKRVELRRQRNELASLEPRTWINNLTSSLAAVVEPLKQLKPSYDTSKGRWNRRLVFCAIHIFIVTVADGYATLSMILYFTTVYKYTPAETGYVLTTLNITGVVVLTFIIPVIVRLLRPLYERTRAPPISLSEDMTLNGTDVDETAPPCILSQLDENEEDSVQVVSDTSDHLDVHITFGSWVIEATAYIVVGTASTLVTQLAAVVCIGLGAGRNPVFRSLVAASVDPLKQGEALAAIEMVASLGSALSPMLMGYIATTTISTVPRTIFYVHAAIIALGASVLFLIRDSDRYQKLASD